MGSLLGVRRFKTKAGAKWPITTVVEISWSDANTRGRWGSREEYLQHKPAPIVSVGYLLVKDKEKVTIIQSQGVDFDDVADAICIPTDWITRMKVLRK